MKLIRETRMKFSRKKLEELIVDVIKSEVKGNYGHSKEDGTFDDGKGSGSISRKDLGQFKRVGGKKAGNREPCGRKDRKRLCSDEVQREVLLGELENNDGLYIRHIIRQELQKYLGEKAKENGCSFNDILKFVRAFKSADSFKYSAPKNS